MWCAVMLLVCYVVIVLLYCWCAVVLCCGCVVVGVLLCWCVVVSCWCVVVLLWVWCCVDFWLKRVCCLFEV